MRGYSDEMGGPESLASPSEWGPLGWGDGVTAAGLPASPGVKSCGCYANDYTYEGVRRCAQCDTPSARLSDDERRRVLFERGLGFLRESPSDPTRLVPVGRDYDDYLRHNFLKRRELSDPGYGASRGFDWRESALRALGVAYVPERPHPREPMGCKFRAFPSPSE